MNTKICPYCKEGHLFLVKAYEPWHNEYYICDKCDSTYTTEEVEKEEIDVGY